MTALTDAVKREFLEACSRITIGQLTLRTPDGELHHFGNNGQQERKVRIIILLIACRPIMIILTFMGLS